MKPALITYVLVDNADPHIVNQPIEAVIKYLSSLKYKNDKSKITIERTTKGNLQLSSVKQAGAQETRDIAEHRVALLNQQRNALEASMNYKKASIAEMEAELTRLDAEANAMRKFLSDK